MRHCGSLGCGIYIALLDVRVNATQSWLCGAGRRRGHVMQVTANGLSMEVETHGPKDGPAVVMIRGLGSQLIHWPAGLYQGLAALGFYVILMDNRDVGLSQRCPDPKVPDTAEEILARLAQGEVVPCAYTLNDMAADVAGVLDALGVAKAHVLGISMGGAIAQILCLDHADRVLSATFVMTAARLMRDPAQAENILPALLATPCARDAYVANFLHEDTMWGSPGYPMTEAALRKQAELAYDRGVDAGGINRQALAVLHAQDRRVALAHVALPCQVIHGAQDRLIPPEAGAELAGVIPHCDHHVIDGMGHVITPKLAPMVVDLVQDFIHRRAA